MSSGGLSAGGGSTESFGGTTMQGGTDGAAPSFRVLLVVDDLRISTDDAIESRLRSLSQAPGIDVESVPEDLVVPEEAELFDLVVISPSADADGIGGSLALVRTPVLVLESRIFGRMGLGGRRTSPSDSQVVVASPEHPIAQGRTGTITICDSAIELEGQETLTGGVAVVQASLNTQAAAVAAYDEGVDINGPLPERRVGMGVLRNASCQSEEAWKFFDGAVLWLLRIPA